MIEAVFFSVAIELLGASDMSEAGVISRAFRPALPGEFRQTVALEYNDFANRWQLYCAGSYLGDGLVLTAGHCAGQYDGTMLRVVYDDTNLGNITLATAGVREQIRHPDFRYIVVTGPDGYENPPIFDFGIIVLDQALPVPQADLGINKKENYYDVKSAIIGWGETEFAMTSDYLLYAEVPVVSDKICSATYKKLRMESALCAGYVGDQSNTCRGDSGGPLLAKKSPNEYTQIGVTSFGTRCGPNSSYGVYGWIGAARPWIEKMKREHGLNANKAP